MTTSFSSLPIVDLSPLSSPSGPTPTQLSALSKQLHDVFATTGFAYLVNAPLSFSHDEVFSLAKEFFTMLEEEKMKLAKKTFRKENENTYRGYFPPQPLNALDNLKEGFEMGPPTMSAPNVVEKLNSKFNLGEPNIWPSAEQFHSRVRAEAFYAELQSLSSTLLSLLATSLGQPSSYFSNYLVDSLSTLRFLHYPPQPQSQDPVTTSGSIKLCCTPHTDSGILTLLHQDPTGGLEVLNVSGSWIPAPYVPGSIVVNIGDLMAKVSGGRFVATIHRVRASSDASGHGAGMGRLSVPFFFEPGENCRVKSVDGGDEGAVYGEHVRGKMSAWVEFQDVEEEKGMEIVTETMVVEAY